MGKKKNTQKKNSAKTGAAIANSVAEALKPMGESDFAKHQLQAQLLTNMAFMMADCFDSIIRDMIHECDKINEHLKFNEKRYWGMILQGCKGIMGITEKCSDVVVNRYQNAADMMCLMHKMMYDRAGSPIDVYRMYKYIKSMPSMMQWKIGEHEEHFAFNHIPAGLREAVDKEIDRYNNKMEMSKDKKTAVLMMSTEFSKWHKQAGKHTMFVDKIANGEKLHTIRTNYDNWCKKAEQINTGEMELSLRIWSGKPYRSQQHEFGRLQHLEVQKFEATYSSEDAVPRVWVDGKEVNAEEVAMRDGLTLDDWVQWMFRGVNKIENGALLQLTKFKY